MSCGNHHETPCSEVIDKVYEFIDDEMPTADCAKIKHHLSECGPCLREYGIEEEVKALVRRSCSEPAPAELRNKVLMRISQVRIEMGDVEISSVEYSSVEYNSVEFSQTQPRD